MLLVLTARCVLLLSFDVHVQCLKAPQLWPFGFEDLRASSKARCQQSSLAVVVLLSTFSV